MKKEQETDQNMSKITTQFEILSENVMEASAQSVNIVGFGCVNLDEPMIDA